MAGSPKSPKSPEASARWFAKVEGGRLSLDEQRDFADWLGEADNARAFDELEQSWEALGEAGGDRELLRMRSAALRKASGPSRRAILGMAGGATAAAVASGVGLMMAGAAQATIRTGPGERLTASLPDGSRVTLAPLSKLRIGYGGSKRAARLDEGQAYFEIRRGKPFRLIAGDRVAECAGGRFQVSLDGARAQILLEDGALQVAADAGGARPLAIRAGQMVSGPAEAPAVTTTSDAEGLTAWRTGRLVFDDEALADVVAAFNRYSRDQLVLAQPELGSIRISGSFRYDGAREFAQAMQAAFGLDVRQVGTSTWSITAASAT